MVGGDGSCPETTGRIWKGCCLPSPAWEVCPVATLFPWGNSHGELSDNKSQLAYCIWGPKQGSALDEGFLTPALSSQTIFPSWSRHLWWQEREEKPLISFLLCLYPHFFPPPSFPVLLQFRGLSSLGLLLSFLLNCKLLHGLFKPQAFIKPLQQRIPYVKVCTVWRLSVVPRKTARVAVSGRGYKKEQGAVNRIRPSFSCRKRKKAFRGQLPTKGDTPRYQRLQLGKKKKATKRQLDHTDKMIGNNQSRGSKSGRRAKSNARGETFERKKEIQPAVNLVKSLWKA